MTSIEQNNRRTPIFFLAEIVLLCLIVFHFSACGEESADFAEGDDVPQDGDKSDGDALEDGDAAGNVHPETIPCYDDADCEGNSACDPYKFLCRDSECVTDFDCEGFADTRTRCAENGLCLPIPCSSGEDCPEAHYCTAGLCRALPTCDEISDIRIDPILPLLRMGESRALTARVLDVHGTVIPSDHSFEWTSMNPDVVSVNGETGLATGGLVSGTTSILVRLTFSETDCRGVSFSNSISLRNFSKETSGVRVVVIDAVTGLGIGDAGVQLNGENGRTPTGIDQGVVRFESDAPPFDIHVFHENYHYFSAYQVQTNDLLIPLAPFHGVAQTGGIRAEPDVPISSLLDPQLMSRFYLIGMGHIGSLLDLSMESLFPGYLKTTNAYHEGRPFNSMIPFPANVSMNPQAAKDFDGIVLSDPSDLPLRNGVFAEGDPGASVAWILGGNIPTADFLDLVTARIHEEWIASRAFLVSALGYSGNFRHGLLGGLSPKALSTIPDDGSRTPEFLNEEDLNGNGITTDFIPDYENFDDLGDTLALGQALNQNLRISIGQMPNLNGNPLEGLLAVIGARTTGNQFVPLGLTSRLLETTEEEETESAGIDLPFSPYYGSLYDRYTTLVMALPFDRVFDPNAKHLSRSVIVRTSDRSPETLESGDFMGFPPFGYPLAEKREFNFVGVEEADFYRISFENDGRRWDVYCGCEAGAADVRTLTLPMPSETDDPYGGQASITAIETSKSAGDTSMTTLDDFLSFNAVPLTRLDRYISRFSVYYPQSR